MPNCCFFLQGLLLIYRIKQITIRKKDGKNMSRIIGINEFKNDVENNKGTVVVDFFATWCGPCKMLSPVYDSIGEEMKDKTEFLKVDIDQSMELALLTLSYTNFAC